MIANKLEHIPILPIGYSKHSREEHLAFGRLLRDELSNSGKRIAIIASGHGAHTLSEESPLPQDESGAQYDEQLVRSLEADSSDQLLQIDQELLEQTDSCLYHSLLILHGAIEDLDYEWNVLSYEAPFGVGYLTAECLIQS
jgi:aromatic ring-opening dioxygenase LigB subunit